MCQDFFNNISSIWSDFRTLFSCKKSLCKSRKFKIILLLKFRDYGGKFMPWERISWMVCNFSACGFHLKYGRPSCRQSLSPELASPANVVCANQEVFREPDIQIYFFLDFRDLTKMSTPPVSYLVVPFFIFFSILT